MSSKTMNKEIQSVQKIFSQYKVQTNKKIDLRTPRDAIESPIIYPVRQHRKYPWRSKVRMRGTTNCIGLGYKPRRELI